MAGERINGIYKKKYSGMSCAGGLGFSNHLMDSREAQQEIE